MLKSILRVLCMLLRARLRWLRPAESDIVVYDATGVDVLSHLLKPWRVRVLHIRGEEINVPIFLGSLFAGQRHRIAYAARFIRAVKPKMLITLMDNNLDFYEISATCPNVSTMFIQNGTRGYYIDAFEHLDCLLYTSDAADE